MSSVLIYGPFEGALIVLLGLTGAVAIARNVRMKGMSEIQSIPINMQEGESSPRK